MARGKQAARSATRRAEAAHEHIDRLTSELVEAKFRARQTEAEAGRVPGLVALVAQLEQRLEAATSVEVERLRSRLEAEAERNEKLRSLLKKMVERAHTQAPKVGLLTEEELAYLNDERATEGWNIVSNRLLRRRRAKGDTAVREKLTIQDNRRSVEENVGAAGMVRFGKDG